MSDLNVAALFQLVEQLLDIRGPFVSLLIGCLDFFLIELIKVHRHRLFPNLLRRYNCNLSFLSNCILIEMNDGRTLGEYIHTHADGPRLREYCQLHSIMRSFVHQGMYSFTRHLDDKIDRIGLKAKCYHSF